ncbi:MAG: penicillin-binding protein 2 [Bdellovibrionaceae bacterium]|nr:penicillin-binding protein 2 [Pseudobdellovibrionaceae bacterium]MDW8189855.1 penicillin-binding protein 2 [Pseudobdellovibrionaceae bacterium]
MRGRLQVIFIVFVLFFGAIIVRSFYLKVFPGPELQSWIDKQFSVQMRIQPRRPTVIDRAGKELVFSVESYSLFVDPQLADLSSQQFRKISSLMGWNMGRMRKKIKNHRSRFLWLMRFLDEESKKKIEKIGLPNGFGFITEYRRIYPVGTALRPLLGGVGVDGQGLSGLELWIDRQLDLRPKSIRVLRDARGRWLSFADDFIRESLIDRKVHLTIDLDLQLFFEKQLQFSVTQQKADSAFAIGLDLNSHEIRAMAFVEKSMPSLVSLPLKNPLINHVYEFGSVLKPLIMAWALENKVVDEAFVADLEGGKFKVADRVIRDVHFDPKEPRMDLRRILMKSSNIGMAKIGILMGEQLLRQGLEQMGFHQKVGLGLPGESRGLIPNPPWNKHLISNISFGQGMAITPLQLITAWAALATDGVWRPPLLIKGVHNDLSSEWDWEAPVDFKSENRIFSQRTLKLMKEFLMDVVSAGGTGEKARIVGYQVAGKTGTAQKAGEQEKGYKKDQYLTSFIGFFPADRPRFLLLVGLDSPRKDRYASQSVAPLFSRLGAYWARKEAIAPSHPEEIESLVMASLQEKEGGKSETKLPSAVLPSKPLDPTTLYGKNIDFVMDYLRTYQVPIKIRGQGDRVSEIRYQRSLYSASGLEGIEVLVE